MNKIVYESCIINRHIRKELIFVNYSGSLSDLNKVNLKKMFRLVIIWLKLLARLISFRPHYIYYTLPPTGVGFLKELPNILLIKLFRTKPIFHLHGKGIQEKVTSRYLKYIYSFCFSNSIVIHLSDGLIKSEFKNINCRNTRFYSAPNGVEKVYDPVNRINIEHKVELLFISNLQESKGVFLLLDVFREIVFKQNNVRLNIIGGFRDKETEHRYLQFIEANDLSSHIKFWGSKYDDEKHKIIAQSDILIHPSFNDAFPLVILEAMQHGLVIIGSDQGAIPEIIDSSFGYVFKTGDKSKLLEILLGLLNNPNEISLKQASAKMKFSKYYTIENFETRMAKIFNEL